MTETIDEIIQETKRRKNKKRNDGFTCWGSNLETADCGNLETADSNITMDAGANLVLDVKTDPGVGDEEGNADGHSVGGDVDGTDGDIVSRRLGREEEEEDGFICSVTTELTDLENKVNSNLAIHAFKMLDTQVHLCAICKCRLLQFAMVVHHHETHEVDIQRKCEKDLVRSATNAQRCRHTGELKEAEGDWNTLDMMFRK